MLWFATTQPDLVEGIRAQLVDKDRSPRWRPASIAELSTGCRGISFRARTDDTPLGLRGERS